jgi:hypothetical protein
VPFIVSERDKLNLQQKLLFESMKSSKEWHNKQLNGFEVVVTAFRVFASVDSTEHSWVMFPVSSVKARELLVESGMLRQIQPVGPSV